MYYIICIIRLLNVNVSAVFFSIFRSRRPEAKPSTSLVLQLMDFEDSLRKTKSKSPEKLSILKSPLSADWKSKMKNGLPLLIYVLIFALFLKVMYEMVSQSSIFVDESMEEELVCF